MSRRSEIISELDSLEGRDDSEAQDRYYELIEELMMADMCLGPMKKAMSQDRKAEE